ncbi:hypothetical protein RZS08_25570, partial [Arthrospira platensis SPKY1]|nr:hypothetical protein [Arthrospira platensis SPKY1]
MFSIQKAAWQGIELPELGIGLDLGRSVQPYVFTSHAHADHTPKRNDLNVFCTAPTLALMRQRGYTGAATVLAFGEWVTLPQARVRLWPAGHILGSAMVEVQNEAGSLLYTGDYRTPAAPTTEGFAAPEHI